MTDAQTLTEEIKVEFTNGISRILQLRNEKKMLVEEEADIKKHLATFGFDKVVVGKTIKELERSEDERETEFSKITAYIEIYEDITGVN